MPYNTLKLILYYGPDSRIHMTPKQYL